MVSEPEFKTTETLLTSPEYGEVQENKTYSHLSRTSSLTIDAMLDIYIGIATIKPQSI